MERDTVSGLKVLHKYADNRRNRIENAIQDVTIDGESKLFEACDE